MRKLPVLLLALLVVLTGCLGGGDNDDEPKDDDPRFIDIDQDQARRLIDNDTSIIVIDVSSRYQEGHITGALNYYYVGVLEDAIESEELDPMATYIVYCHVDFASGNAAQDMIDAGFSDVYRLSTHYASWRDAGYPITTGPTPGSYPYPDPDDGTTPDPDNGTTPDPDNGTTPDPDNGTTPDPDNGTTPDPDNGTTPDTDNGTTPDTDNPTTIPGNVTMVNITQAYTYVLGPEPFTVVDVSPEDLFRQGRMPGAVNVPFDPGNTTEFNASVAALTIPGPTLVYAHDPNVAGMAASLMTIQTSSDIHLLDTSYLDWVFRGYPEDHDLGDGFGPFIVPVEDYFVTRIGGVPEVDGSSYVLNVTGLVTENASFTLEELRALPRVDLPLTVECIGNPAKGSLLGTAVWGGFEVYDLLESVGLEDNATAVRFSAADGYFASYTLDQLRNETVIGALWMNGDIITPEQGYPMRVVIAGYYGVKQPMWVTEIEVMDRPLEDYWTVFRWDVSPPIAIDAKFQFPSTGSTFTSNTSFEVGGVAFGGTRATGVEVTYDAGSTWIQADIVRSLDLDDLWVFWKVNVTIDTPGNHILQARATDVDGNVQPESDPNRLDGTHSWPALSVTIAAD